MTDNAGSTGPPGVTRHIGILLFDGMEELDAVGPWEVFAWWTRHHPLDGWSATTFSPDGRAVTCEKTLVLTPHHSADSAPPLDVLLHPGGDGTEKMLADQAHLQWLRVQRTRVPLITSVCTGSTVLAAAGLLRGRPATSNRSAPRQRAVEGMSVRCRSVPSCVLRSTVIVAAAGSIATLP